MTYWEKYISEEMTAAQKKKAAEEVMDDLTGKKKKKKGKKDKGKSEYTEYLNQQLEYKRQKYEDQKKREIEKRKERSQKESEGKARQALSSIKQQTISYKDQDPTAYRKAIENVGSAAAGIGKAAYYALQARRKKKQAEKEQSKQPEKKEPGKPGRPKAEGGNVQVADVTPKKKERNVAALSGTPERKKLVPSAKRLPPASKKIGPAGGTPYQTPPAPDRETGMRLGQRARRNPALKSALIKSRMEEYSNWKEEFIFEVDDKMNKVEKKKVIDIMTGKNNIELNPSVMEDHKEIASGKKKDDEGYMANVELDQMERAIKSLRKKLKRSDTQLPAWVQSKITRAADYVDTASEYMQSEEGLSEEIDKKKLLVMLMLKAADNAKRRKNSQLINGIIGEDNINEIAPVIAALGRAALGTAARQGAKAAVASEIKDIAKEKIKRGVQSSLLRAGQKVNSGGATVSPEEGGASAYMKALTNIVGEEVEISEGKKSEMKCNKPKAQAHGSGETGKSHVVKACEGGEEKLIRFGQLGVKGSPKKEGESEAYASRRNRFKTRHAKNIARGKMSAAYWANKVKW
jgi:hypothetical protein